MLNLYKQLLNYFAYSIFKNITFHRFSPYVAETHSLVWIYLPLDWHMHHLLLVLLFSNAQAIVDAWTQWSVIFDTLGLRCVKFHRYTKLRTWRSAAGEKCKGGNGFDKLTCKKLHGRHLMEKHKFGSIVWWVHAAVQWSQSLLRGQEGNSGRSNKLHTCIKSTVPVFT